MDEREREYEHHSYLLGKATRIMLKRWFPNEEVKFRYWRMRAKIIELLEEFEEDNRL